jgi:uncharacterized protein (TIRG00374 family)
MLALTFLKFQLHPAFHVGWRFDPRGLWAVVRSHPWAFLAATVAEAAIIPLRALQWGWLLPPGQATLRERYHAVAVGSLARNILPANAGELVRGLALSRARPELGRTRALTTVATSKMGELAAVLTCVAVAPHLVQVQGALSTALTRGGEIGLLVLAGLVALALGLTRARGRIHRLEGLLRRLPGAVGRKLAVLLEELGHGAAACGSARRMFMAYLFSLPVLGASVVAYTFALGGVGAPMSVGVALVVQVVVSAGMSLPASPSGVGVYHLACIYALTSLGVGALPAAAFSLATHLIATGVNLGMGVVSLWGAHQSLGGLLQTQEPAEESLPAPMPQG